MAFCAYQPESLILPYCLLSHWWALRMMASLEVSALETQILGSKAKLSILPHLEWAQEDKLSFLGGLQQRCDSFWSRECTVSLLFSRTLQPQESLTWHLKQSHFPLELEDSWVSLSWILKRIIELRIVKLMVWRAILRLIDTLTLVLNLANQRLAFSCLLRTCVGSNTFVFILSLLFVGRLKLNYWLNKACW